MLRGDHNEYFCFYSCPDQMAESKANALLDLCPAFGAHQSFMSYSAAPFKIERIYLLTKVFIQNITSLFHIHCSPTAVEHLGKLQRIARLILSETQPLKDELLQLLQIFPSAIND